MLKTEKALGIIIRVNFKQNQKDKNRLLFIREKKKEKVCKKEKIHVFLFLFFFCLRERKKCEKIYIMLFKN